MSRTRSLYLGLLALFVGVLTAIVPASAQQQKPNILFIMGDDIGWMQPSIYHQGLMVGETPNIDRIGQEGARFTDYYASLRDIHRLANQDPHGCRRSDRRTRHCLPIRLEPPAHGAGAVAEGTGDLHSLPAAANPASYNLDQVMQQVRDMKTASHAGE